jgi:ATP-dependent DNA helicase DinG
MIKRLAGNIPYWIFRRMEEMEELFGWFLKNDKRYILFLQQDSRGHLTFMAVNREIPKYLDATLWNRGFVDTNGKYYELWNAQAQYYTE